MGIPYLYQCSTDGVLSKHSRFEEIVGTGGIYWGMGAMPKWSLEAEPLVKESGGHSPQKLKAFCCITTGSYFCIS